MAARSGRSTPSSRRVEFDDDPYVHAGDEDDVAAQADQDALDDDESDEDDLTQEEARLGLKVVELGPNAFRGTKRGSDGRIFHEFHPNHPDGEALVVKGRRVKVYPTLRVQRALGEGLLRETRKEATPQPPHVADVLDQARQEAAALQQSVVAAQAQQAAATLAAQAQQAQQSQAKSAEK